MSPHRKEELGKGLGAGPVRLTGLNLEVSSKCNMNCHSCFRRTYVRSGKDELIYLASVDRILPELKFLHSIDLTGWGEPLMHPEFGRICREIRHNFPGQLSFTTNGLLMDEEKITNILEAEVDTISFSVDASGETGYKKVRGKSWNDLEKVMVELIRKKLVRGRGLPRIFANFLLRKSRLDDIYSFVQRMEGFGLNGVVFQQLAGIISDADLEEITYSGYYDTDFNDAALSEKIKMLKKQYGKALEIIPPETIFHERQGGCGVFPPDHLFIKVNGDVSPCCTLAYPVLFLGRDRELRPPTNLTFGNINKQSLAEIWDSDAAVEFREQMIEKGSANACADCIGLYLRRI
jgi:Fe-coproporphyrin III synthase